MTQPTSNTPLQRARHLVYLRLEPEAWPDKGLSLINKVICALILLAAMVAIVETEPSVFAGRERLFLAFELVVGSLFLLEYLVRLWAIVEHPAYRSPIKGRLRYMCSAPALIDLLAILPVLVGLFGIEALFMRLFRVLRILRLARLGRFSSAMRNLGQAVRSRRYEFYVSLAIAFVVLLISSMMLYLLEGGAQPDAFGSIPRAMWWSVATLTTVGYGDVYPITGLGRLFAAMTAIAGIGIIAMPTGIMAAAFSEAMQKNRGRD